MGGGTKYESQWICFKWPVNLRGNGRATGGCRLEIPWVFKTLKNVGALAFDGLKHQHRELTSQGKVVGVGKSGRPHGSDLVPSRDTASISKTEKTAFPLVGQFFPQLKAGITSINQWGKGKDSAVVTTKDELGELEESALAQALAIRKPATIIEFYSPRCTLCRSLVSVVTELERKHDEWLHIVMVDVENKRWLPEVLLYDIKYVPCFLLLDSHGNALVKTGVPYSRKHVLQGLTYLLESMKPLKNRVRYLEADSAVPGDPS